MSFGFYNVSTARPPACLVFVLWKVLWDRCSPGWRSARCTELGVHAGASLREEVQPLDVGAVAVFMKAAPGMWLAFSFCLRVWDACVLLGEGGIALLEAQMSMTQK